MSLRRNRAAMVKGAQVEGQARTHPAWRGPKETHYQPLLLAVSPSPCSCPNSWTLFLLFIHNLLIS